MTRATVLLVWACAVLWAAFAAQGVFAYLTLEPTDSGFTRGLNRVMAFLRWEAIALGVALVGYVAGRGMPKGVLTHFAARWPLWLSGGFFLLLIILFVATVIIARMSG